MHAYLLPQPSHWFIRGHTTQAIWLKNPACMDDIRAVRKKMYAFGRGGMGAFRDGKLPCGGFGGSAARTPWAMGFPLPPHGSLPSRKAPIPQRPKGFSFWGAPPLLRGANSCQNPPKPAGKSSQT